jgi:hypothetical protein
MRERSRAYSTELSINELPISQIILDTAWNYLTVIAKGNRPDANPDPLKRGRMTRRNTMKTMLLAAAAALSLGVASAYADGGDGAIANTYFTELPGVVAQAQVPNAPVYAQNGQAQSQQAQNGQGVHDYATQSNRGTWLFAPNGNGGANS